MSPLIPLTPDSSCTTVTCPFVLSQFWDVRKDEEGVPSVRFLANHKGLANVVNALRFSPCGE